MPESLKFFISFRKKKKKEKRKRYFDKNLTKNSNGGLKLKKN